MWPHAAHKAQGTHARAKMTGQGQFLHVLMRMGCGDELDGAGFRTLISSAMLSDFETKFRKSK